MQYRDWRLVLTFLLEDVGKAALATVLTVMMPSHEDTSTALGGRTLTSETGDLTVLVDLVVLENSQLDLLVLVLDLLGGSVGLLLSLLGTTTKTENQVEGRLLLDVVVGESTAILELLTSEDQTLLIRRDSCRGWVSSVD
ncbi:hypothetical protein K493DRAFT_106674 [Basidiobolus meristosporus CBS 931.73]|uniref:Uncharacterized protein n=1 Tax=Basidiobolus meristosporus CBS 931.73 TaxID=1314790 RepID=A0A1Y1ZAI6_9FUNG|nr:hypothetical protein K493DRAFT_106674 [Basidiobolus meristosporus CBS 931.73]|eukprot:ORY07323.1 hypothetical protein K493DRAFT_106674 [Basidiobolus meristosporus CBS 931.73]